VIRAACSVATAAFLAAGAAWATSPNDIVTQDLAQRSLDVHWPAEIAPPNVDMFSHNEATIRAGCGQVWSVLLNASAWPNWYPNSHDVRIACGSDRLSPKAFFDWDTFGVHIHSVVAEFEPPTRLAWFGDGPNVRAYHTWLLQSAGHACHVVTEEATKGPAAREGRAKDPDALHRGHDLWLDSLKTTVEMAGRQG
jgi:Polyketide cyclase / dehydrase and lipid transport